MFAAIPLAVRIGGPIALALLVAGGWYLYKESLRDEGRDEIQAQHAEEVQQQQESVRMVEAAQYEALLEVVDRTAQESKKFHHNLIQSKKESARKDAEIQRLQAFVTATQRSRPDVEVRYVESQPDTCLVPPHVTARVDELSGVLNAIPYRRVSEDVGPDPQPPLPGPGAATCAQLIGRLEVLTARLGDALVAHRGLTEYVERERAINATFHVHTQER